VTKAKKTSTTETPAAVTDPTPPMNDDVGDFRNLRVFKRTFGLGWSPDYPDIRDYTLETPAVASVLGSTVGITTLPTNIDLRSSFSPIEDQSSLGSCTSQAAVGLLEYYERTTLQRHVDASRLFLYKVTRKLLGWTGDTGAYLRTTMKALALFGAPPEEHYPYNISQYDAEPDAFAYALAQNWQALSYYRLDPAGISGQVALDTLKSRLAQRQPAMFGFTVYSSLPTVTTTGEIPYPRSTDRVVGGHAVVAAGYDDNKLIDGVAGAILIRNSWGTSWGMAGYGWLPYRYFTNRIATDIWSMVRSEYIDLAPFA
jgi:C1A family cysteine protease